MRKVLYVTGTRSDYGVMKDVLKEVNAHPDLVLSLIVTGMHLLEKFGYTISDIRKDSYDIVAEIPLDPSSGNRGAMAKELGRAIIEITGVLEREKPDIILIQGDRGEGLAGAIAGAYLGIPIAHVSGGDVTEGGMIDDSIRHCITKLAHLHFPGTVESAARIECMGENPSSVYMVGTPSLLGLNDISESDARRMLETFHIDPALPLLLVIQHPVTYEREDAGDQMQKTMDAVMFLKEQTIVFYPNSDAGGQDMINIIKNYENVPFIRTTQNLSYNDFIVLLSSASVLLGNSSAGIVRTASLGVPCINIGTRQKNREQAGNIIDVGYNSEEIIEATKKILSDRSIRDTILSQANPYKNQNAGKKIAEILAKADLSKENLIKKFHMPEKYQSC